MCMSNVMSYDSYAIHTGSLENAHARVGELVGATPGLSSHFGGWFTAQWTENPVILCKKILRTKQSTSINARIFYRISCPLSSKNILYATCRTCSLAHR